MHVGLLSWFQGNLVSITWLGEKPPYSWEFNPPLPQPLPQPVEEHEPFSPYEPPPVEEFYKPPTSPDSQEKDVHVIENKDNRPYGHFEAHYNEPPMTHEEDYIQPERAYEAKDFDKFVKEKADEPLSQETTEDSNQMHREEQETDQVSHNASEVNTHNASQEPEVTNDQSVRQEQESPYPLRPPPEKEARSDNNEKDRQVKEESNESSETEPEVKFALTLEWLRPELRCLLPLAQEGKSKKYYSPKTSCVP